MNCLCIFKKIYRFKPLNFKEIFVFKKKIKN